MKALWFVVVACGCSVGVASAGDEQAGEAFAVEESAEGGTGGAPEAVQGGAPFAAPATGGTVSTGGISATGGTQATGGRVATGGTVEPQPSCTDTRLDCDDVPGCEVGMGPDDCGECGATCPAGTFCSVYFKEVVNPTASVLCLSEAACDMIATCMAI